MKLGLRASKTYLTQLARMVFGSFGFPLPLPNSQWPGVTRIPPSLPPLLHPQLHFLVLGSSLAEASLSKYTPECQAVKSIHPANMH